MLVSFVIPLFNCLPLTQDALRTLIESLPRDLSYEIILIDNDSTDGTRDWLARIATTHTVILNETNLGYAAANNRAAARARGDLLCLINNDLVFHPGWLQPMLRLHRRFGSRAGAIGNVQRRVADRTIDHAGIGINARGKPEHDHGWRPWPRQSRIVPAVTGACLLIYRRKFLDLGGFDERFQNGGEDVDLCFRLSRIGLVNAVALRSTVLHHVSASPGRKRRDEANSHLLATKWRHELSRLAWRNWCWHELEQHWSGSRDPAAWPEALALLSDTLHLRTTPSLPARAGLERMMAAEFQRWDRILPSESGI